MPCRMQLPERAIAMNSAAEIAAGTPMSSCLSPLDQWLGVPTMSTANRWDEEQKKQQALPSMMQQEATAMSGPFQMQLPQMVPMPLMQQPQFQQPCMQQQQPQQAMIMTNVSAAAQAQSQQATWVYFVPMAPAQAGQAAAPAPPCVAASSGFYPQQQSAFSTGFQPLGGFAGMVNNGVTHCEQQSTTCSSMDLPEMPSLGSVSSDSEDARASKNFMHGGASGSGSGVLSASAARRRRRQRAAAYARAEKLEQEMAESDLGQAPVSPRGSGSKMNPVTAETLTPELLAELSQQIKAGGNACHTAIVSMKRSARRFTFDGQGCRVLQDAIAKGSHEDVVSLLDELRGSVLRASTSPHGNFVIQKIIEHKTANVYHFIIQELRGYGVETAKHRFGCRIMCRLLEHASSDDRVVQLIDEALGAVGDLVRHEFGHYVIESILEHGLEMHKRQVYLALEAEAALNVCSRNALFVLDKALKQATPGERFRLSNTLRKQPETKWALADPTLANHLSSILALGA